MCHGPNNCGNSQNVSKHFFANNENHCLPLNVLTKHKCKHMILRFKNHLSNYLDKNVKKLMNIDFFDKIFCKKVSNEMFYYLSINVV